MNLDVGIGVKGLVRTQVIRHGKCRFDSGFQTNMILDKFFNRVSATSATRYGCQVGTGTAVPVGADTSIKGTSLGMSSGAPVRTYTKTGLGGGNWKKAETCKFTFAVGQIIGIASELVFRNSSTVTSEAIVRALIKDVNGNATSITLTNEDQLVVTHTMEFTLNAYTSAPFAVSFGGTDYQVKMKFTPEVALSAQLSDSDWCAILFGINSYPYIDMENCFATVRLMAGDYTNETSTGNAVAQTYYSQPANMKAERVSQTWATGVLTTVLRVTVFTPALLGTGAVIEMGNYLGSSVYPVQFFFTPNLVKANNMQLKFNFTIRMSRA